jgi:hypothetical protein
LRIWDPGSQIPDPRSRIQGSKRPWIPDPQHLSQVPGAVKLYLNQCRLLWKSFYLHNLIESLAQNYDHHLIKIDFDVASQCKVSVVPLRSCRLLNIMQGPEPAGAGLPFLVQSAGGSPDCPLLPATYQVHAIADTST